MPYAKGLDGAWEVIQQLLRDKGAIRPRDMARLPMSPNWLKIYRWEIPRVGPGIHAPRGATLDPIALQSTKYPRLIASLTTALWLHGITDRPRDNWWLMGPRDHLPGWRLEASRFLRSRWALEGVEELTVDRVPVRVHSPMWAALHCVRFRSELGTLTARDAVVRALDSGTVNPDAFFEAAARRHVLRPLKQLLTLDTPSPLP